MDDGGVVRWTAVLPCYCPDFVIRVGSSSIIRLIAAACYNML